MSKPTKSKRSKRGSEGLQPDHRLQELPFGGPKSPVEGRMNPSTATRTSEDINVANLPDAAAAQPKPLVGCPVVGCEHRDSILCDESGASPCGLGALPQPLTAAGPTEEQARAIRCRSISTMTISDLLDAADYSARCREAGRPAETREIMRVPMRGRIWRGGTW